MRRDTTEIQTMSKSSKAAAAKASAPAKMTHRLGTQAKRKMKAVATPVCATDNAVEAPSRQSKKAIIVTLLQRPEGASIGDLCGATGWQPHSVRAALTGLRHKGEGLTRVTDAGGITHYRIAAAA